MKYQGLILLKEEGHSLKACLELLKIPSSSFYDWTKRSPSKREERDGEKVGKDKIAKLMKEEGLSAKKRKHSG